MLEGQFKTLLAKLQPSEDLVRVATAMFEDLWNHRLASGAARTKALRAELAKVERQEGQLLDRIVEASARRSSPLRRTASANSGKTRLR